MQQPSVTGLDHLVLTVADLDRTIAFYTRVLGLTHSPFTAADGSVRHALSFGAQKINLHRSGAEFDPKAAHPTAGSADLCFVTEAPITDWQRHFADVGAAVVEGPVPRSGAQGPILSLYLRDPDGNLIEVGART